MNDTISHEKIVSNFEKILGNDPAAYARTNEAVYQVTLSELLQFSDDLVKEARTLGFGTPLAEPASLRNYVADAVVSAASQSWKSPLRHLPAPQLQVGCILRHHVSRAIEERSLIYCEDDAGLWCVVDGEPLDPAWQVIAWRILS